AGAFATVLEVVPADLADAVTRAVSIPTIGIGAGSHTDAQVLVWQDMAGLTPGKPPKFVKQYADLRSVLTDAVQTWAGEVVSGTYPGPEHQYS
ncbi:MAG: 3-methyl-2-oxobutanoate hydroxymethyltransferase, partial [Candidatus Nanopelagicales bacterium]|nr:3-methyl-2-oxobutanoate hydroxymethyltransferase [Candidatus Nanopelagicales bacterium]